MNNAISRVSLKKSYFFILFFLALVCSFAANVSANICHEEITPEAREEALALESEQFTTNYRGTASLATLGTAEDIREYHAQLITCNRKRDTRGNDIYKALENSNTFEQDLQPRTVEGAYNWYGGGSFSQYGYGYILSREAGTWIVKLPIEFHWPGTRLTDRIDIPMELADTLGLREPGGACHAAETVFNRMDPRKVESGAIMWELRGAQQQAFIDAQNAHNLEQRRNDPSAPLIVVIDQRSQIDSGSFQDSLIRPSTYDLSWANRGIITDSCRLPRDLVLNNKSILNHLRDFWLLKIPAKWDRLGFVVRPVFVNCEEPPSGTVSSCDASVTPEQVRAWKRDDVIYNVHFNLIPLHRALYKRALWKWNNMYSGIAEKVFNHEIGHYFGLDDDYGEKKEPGEGRDCNQFFAGASGLYFMCSQWANNGVQGVYPWIITRRYSIAREFQCASDGECQGDQFCDHGGLFGVGRNSCEAKRTEGGSCSRESICADGFTCRGEPVGKCRATRNASLGSLCIEDRDCESGNCSSKICRCQKNADCGEGQYCDTGTLGIGVNECKEYKNELDACSADKQCLPPSKCISGRCLTQGSKELGESCLRDRECSIGKCGTNNICVCTEDAHCWPDRCIKKAGKPNRCE